VRKSGSAAAVRAGEVPTLRVPFNPAGVDLDTIADRLERAL